MEEIDWRTGHVHGGAPLTVPQRNGSGLLDLAGDIYEAACDARHWTVVLERLAAITGSRSAMLAYRDLEQPRASFRFSYNLSPEILELYARKYSAIDPFFELSARTVPLGKTSADHKMVPDRQHLEAICGEFFSGMMKPYDLWHIGGAHLFLDDQRAAAVALQRGRAQGPWSDEELARVDLLVPHFQRAFRIHKEFVRLQLKEQALLVALDRLVIGLVLMDRRQRVVYTNPMADAILASHPALKLSGDTVRATRKIDASRLDAMLEKATVAADQSGDNPINAIGLRHKDAELPLPLLVTPVSHTGITGVSAVEGASIAVLMTDPQQSQPISPDTLCDTYGLTRAEAMVAIAIANGMTIDEIQAAHHTSKHTVRSQLKSVFGKLNVSRQAELVKLLLTGPFSLVHR